MSAVIPFAAHTWRRSLAGAAVLALRLHRSPNARRVRVHRDAGSWLVTWTQTDRWHGIGRRP